MPLNIIDISKLKNIINLFDMPRTYTSFGCKNDDQLIEFVESHRVLYDSEYRDNPAKRRLWKQISRKIGRSEVDCKRRWRTLRDYYKKTMKKNPANIGGQLVRRLDFLKGVSGRIRTKTSGVERLVNDSSESYDQPALLSFINVGDIKCEADKIIEADNNKDEENIDSYSYTSHSSTDNKQYRSDDQLEEFIPEPNRAQMLSDIVYLKKDVTEADELRLFFNSMEQIARKFPPRLQLQVKRTVSNIMFDFEERFYDEKAAENLC